MKREEQKISEYIDKLNAEKKPEEHAAVSASDELDKLMRTVRKVRTLKEPVLPSDSYPQKLAAVVTSQLTQNREAVSQPNKAKKKLTMVKGVVSAIAAVALLVLVFSFLLQSGRGNIVNAMEQAYEGVKAYHGILVVSETNGQGDKTTQAKLEVWADRQGRYYVKQLEGSDKGLITVNNGTKKWQIRSDDKKVYTFAAFPDPYRFSLELGREINEVSSALEIRKVGEENISGRNAEVLEVSPAGGELYRIWVDTKTKMPLQRQIALQNSLQYTVSYSELNFIDALPSDLLSFSVPEGFVELGTNPEQLVGSIEEAAKVAGFVPQLPKTLSQGYERENIAVAAEKKIIKLYYISQDKQSRIVLLQGKATNGLNPVSTAMLGKVGGSIAEIQSPVAAAEARLLGDGVYAGVTGICSIRWQENGLEYAATGNVPIESLAAFVREFTGEEVKVPVHGAADSEKPKIQVKIDLEAEGNDQKSVDAGHSPWKLDPAFVTQVFASLKLSPEGITGDYPVNYAEIKIVKNDGRYAIAEIGGEKTIVRRVYLERLIRQDSTGIWTVTGYDPVE